MEIRSQTLARNTLINFIGQVLPLLAGLVALPLIIHGLGTDRFGILSLAWVILGYFSVFDLGLGRATTKYVAEALGIGNEDQVPGIVWTAVTVQGILGAAGSLIVLAVTPVIVERILNIPAGLIEETKETFSLLAISVPLILVSSSFSGALEAAQKFDLVNAVRVPSSLLSFLIPLLGLALGYRLPGIVLLIALSRCLSLIALVMLALRVFPALHKYSTHVSLFMKLLKFGGWVSVSSIAGPVINYLDRFLIGSFLTMTTVAYYSAPFDIMTRIWIIPGSLVMTLFPAFSALGMARKEDLQAVFVRSIKYLLLSTGPIILVLMVFSSQLLDLWLGADFAQQSSFTFQILLLGAFIGLLAPVSGALLQGLGRPELLSKLYLIEIPLNVVVVWILVQKMGIVGAAISFAVRAAIETVILFFLSSKLLSFRFHFALDNGLARAVVMLGFLAVLLLMVSLTKVIILQISLVIALILTFMFMAWAYVFDEKDKKIFASMTEKLLSLMRIARG